MLPLEALGEDPSCLSQLLGLLGVLGAPWLIGTSLQSLLLSLYGLPPSVSVTATPSSYKDAMVGFGPSLFPSDFPLSYLTRICKDPVSK